MAGFNQTWHKSISHEGDLSLLKRSWTPFIAKDWKYTVIFKNLLQKKLTNFNQTWYNSSLSIKGICQNHGGRGGWVWFQPHQKYVGDTFDYRPLIGLRWAIWPMGFLSPQQTNTLFTGIWAVEYPLCELIVHGNHLPIVGTVCSRSVALGSDTPIAPGSLHSSAWHHQELSPLVQKTLYNDILRI
jgi:hypothetical protein